MLMCMHAYVDIFCDSDFASIPLRCCKGAGRGLWQHLTKLLQEIRCCYYAYKVLCRHCKEVVVTLYQVTTRDQRFLVHF